MAKRVLTAALIQKIRPPAKGDPQLDIFDKGHPGLFLRVPFGGTKAFVHAYRHGGRQYRRTLGIWPVMQLAEAERHGAVIALPLLPVEIRARRLLQSATASRPWPKNGSSATRLGAARVR